MHHNPPEWHDDDLDPPRGTAAGMFLGMVAWAIVIVTFALVFSRAH